LRSFSGYCAAGFSELIRGKPIRAVLRRIARFCGKNFADRRSDREKTGVAGMGLFSAIGAPTDTLARACASHVAFALSRFQFEKRDEQPDLPNQTTPPIL
jgi:hypothetical protein